MSKLINSIKTKLIKRLEVLDKEREEIMDIISILTLESQDISYSPKDDRTDVRDDSQVSTHQNTTDPIPDANMGKTIKDRIDIGICLHKENSYPNEVLYVKDNDSIMSQYDDLKDKGHTFYIIDDSLDEKEYEVIKKLKVLIGNNK